MRLAAIRQLWPTVLVVAAWLALSGSDAWQAGEARLLDTWFALRGPVPASGEVVLVVIDDESVGRLGGWPPPRHHLARLVDRLADAGARVVAFDLLLSEPGRAIRDRTLPEPDQADRAADLYVLQDDRDGHLISAMARHGTVVLPFAFVFRADQTNRDGLPVSYERAAFSIVHMAGGQATRLPAPSGVLGPADPLADAALAMGHVTAVFDPDGRLRTDRTVLAFDGLYFPSLAVEIARIQFGLPREAVTVDLGGALMLGDRPIPLDERMRLWINFRGDLSSMPAIPAHRVLEPDDRTADRPDPLADLVQGRAVLIGAQALGLGDTYRTPFADQLPGMAIIAMAADGMITGDSLIRPLWRETAALAGMLAVGLLVWTVWLRMGRRGAAGRRRRPRTAIALATLGSLAIVVSALAVLFAAFAGSRIWLDGIGPVAAGLAQGTCCAIGTLARERRARQAAERRSTALEERVGHAQRLVGDASGPVMATVLFTDLVGFTRFAEEASPDRVLELVRSFQSMVVDAVVDTGGVIDSYMGDGAMACFGIGDAGPQPAAQAVRAARRLIDRWHAHTAGIDAPGPPAPDVAVGIHSGFVVAGDVGHRHLIRFTLVGDTVNLASRMEQACRDHACRLVITEPVWNGVRAAGDTADLDGLAALGPVDVRGRDRPVAAWGLPIGPSGPTPRRGPGGRMQPRCG